MTAPLLITGATGNLGRRIVPVLANERPCVALYRDGKAWERLRLVSPATLTGIACDLADPSSIDTAFVNAKPAHVLHLAGGWSGGSIGDTSDETWMRAFEANLHPAFRVLRAALRHLPRGGSIVFTSSIGAGQLRPGMAAYIVAKSALETLVKLGAREAEPLGLRVNALAPDTIGDAAGEVSPERILSAARLLLADESASGRIVALPA